MTHHIAATPVQQVEVVIIHHVWGIQNLLRGLRQGSEGFVLRPLPQVLGVDAHVALVPWRRRWSLQEGFLNANWLVSSYELALEMARIFPFDIPSWSPYRFIIWKTLFWRDFIKKGVVF